MCEHVSYKKCIYLKKDKKKVKIRTWRKKTPMKDIDGQMSVVKVFIFIAKYIKQVNNQKEVVLDRHYRQIDLLYNHINQFHIN